MLNAFWMLKVSITKTPNMEYMMEHMRSQKNILEINTHHPVMNTLLEYVEEDEITKEMEKYSCMKQLRSKVDSHSRI
jgi:hypothetical protein